MHGEGVALENCKLVDEHGQLYCYFLEGVQLAVPGLPNKFDQHIAVILNGRSDEGIGDEDLRGGVGEAPAQRDGDLDLLLLLLFADGVDVHLQVEVGCTERAYFECGFLDLAQDVGSQLLVGPEAAQFRLLLLRLDHYSGCIINFDSLRGAFGCWLRCTPSD